MPTPIPGNVVKTSTLGVSSFSLPSLTVPAGKNAAIVVFTGWSSPSAQQTVSVVWNAPSTQTFEEPFDELRGLNHRCSGNLLRNPTPGSYTITVNCTGVEDELWASAIVVEGVDADAAILSLTNEGTSSTNPSVSLSGVTPLHLVLDGLYSFATSITSPGANQTEYATEEGIGAFASGASSYQPGSAGGVMDWTTPSANFIVGAIALLGLAEAIQRPMAPQQRFA